MSDGELKRALRQTLIERDGDVCNHCGKPGGDTDQTKLTIDRIVAGGAYTADNCQLLCRSCNSSKGVRSDKHVRWASGVFQRGFTIVPNVVLLNHELSTAARLTWIALAHFAREDDFAYPGQDKLATLVGISERKLRDCVAELGTAGLVRVHQRGRGQTNIYVLLDPRDRQEVPPGSAGGAGQDRQEPPVSSDLQAVEGKAVEEGTALAATGAAGAEPQLFAAPPATPPAAPSTLDADTQTVWDHYATLFADRLRVKELTPPRKRTVQKALKAAGWGEDGREVAIELCLRAISGLKSYRASHPDGSQDVNISVIFETGPHSKSNLTDQIQWWADQSESTVPIPGAAVRVPIDLVGVPSVSKGTIQARRREVGRMYDHPESPEARERGEAAVDWLKEHVGHKPKIVDGELRGWELTDA